MPIGLGKMYTQSQIDTANRGTIEERQRRIEIVCQSPLLVVLSYNTRKKKKGENQEGECHANTIIKL
jgi:hypothetical protein